MAKYSITAMVPAKVGSTRLPAKNLALLRNKPLIYYAVKAALDSKVFDRVVINAEDALFEKIAARYKVNFYQRPSSIVGPATKTDTVVYDFLCKNPCDIVAWVSPIAPFQTGEEVGRMVRYFIDEKLDSLMTVKDEQTHCVYKGKPVNFRINEIFAQTQDLVPVKSFVYSTMMWRSSAFIKAFRRNGHAILCGKVGFFTVSKLSSIIIKKKDDFMAADYIMRAIAENTAYRVKYDRAIFQPKKACAR